MDKVAKLILFYNCLLKQFMTSLSRRLVVYFAFEQKGLSIPLNALD